MSSCGPEDTLEFRREGILLLPPKLEVVLPTGEKIPANDTLVGKRIRTKNDSNDYVKGSEGVLFSVHQDGTMAQIVLDLDKNRLFYVSIDSLEIL